jgi:PKD repeat protein
MYLSSLIGTIKGTAPLLFISAATLLLVGCSEPTRVTPPPPPAPTADFTVSPASGPAPLTVTLVNKSEPAAATSNWMFSDGGISNETNPVYTFQDPGTYSIVLLVTNESGTAEMIHENIVVTGVTLPLPPTGPFPDGPLDMQIFSFIGNSETIAYEEGVETEFEVVTYLKEDGISGTPSKLGGFGVSLQYFLDDGFAVATSAIWSDYVMSIHGGDGPDMIIGGLYDGNEVNMGCVASVAMPADFYYLPPSTPVELIKVTYKTVPTVLLGRTVEIRFHFGDSVTTPNSNGVSVFMHSPWNVASARIQNGHLLVNDWRVILEPQL